MKRNPRIVFYGTPEIAVASLRRIVEEGFPVAAVVTAPDKPSGRGLRLAASPVKEEALRLGIPVLQPDSLKDLTFLDQLRQLAPDLQVVVAFRMMPKQVWSLPPLGTFNLHASLLPQYRGAAPINWAVINGETETGVTTFLLEEKVDTGNILYAEKASIRPDETAGELHDRLMRIGSGLVVKTIHGLVSGSVTPIPQPDLLSGVPVLRPAPKFTKEDARIDWTSNYRDVYNLIRGMSPKPGAHTEIPLSGGGAMTLKILKAEAVPCPESIPGSGFLTDGKTFLEISAAGGRISLKTVQPAGRKVMTIVGFLNGFGSVIC